MPAPFATLVMNTYQQQAYVGEAVEAVLAQECSPLEIVISDDCSTDATYDVIQQAVSGYTGPHRVRTLRQPRNLGVQHLAHLVSEHVQTPLVILAHGDDAAYPHRAKTLIAEWQKQGVMLLGSNADMVSHRGEPMGVYLKTTEHGPFDARTLVTKPFQGEFLGASLLFEKRLYEAPFGVPDPNVVFGGTDIILPLRAALLAPPGRIGVGFVPQALLRYRRHEEQQTFGLAEWGMGAAAREESFRAHHVPFLVHTVRDIQALRRASPQRADLVDLERLALRVLLDASQAWAGSRVALLHGGLRPAWLTKEEHKERRKKAGLGNPGGAS